MANRVENLPFTVYDVLGYAGPGFFGLVYFSGLWLLNDGSFSLIVLSDLNFGFFGDFIATTLIIVISYILGHVFSFVSSLTVEKLSTSLLGYPSRFSAQSGWKDSWDPSSHFCKYVREKPVLAGLIFLFFFPYSIILFIFIQVPHARDYLGKRLDKSIIDIMKDRFRALNDKRFYIDFENSPSNWFKYLEFYCINNLPGAAGRMYNYLTIYGLMRSCCLIFHCGFWISFWFSFYGSVHLGNIFIFISLVSLLFSFTTFLGFQKFFRRYTEEAILAFSTHQSLAVESSPTQRG